MFFINPTYLWALLGLAIPIAIHLWSKKEGKTIKVGSIQLLKTADTKQSSSIKLNEFWLLMLRLCLISILVLIMSNVKIAKKVDAAPITYIVEPTLLQNKKIKAILDTISEEIPIKVLQKGFPDVDLNSDYSKSVSSVPNYWQLAKEMEWLPTDSIIVFTSAYVSGFKSLRPEISKPIEWIPITNINSKKHFLKANELDKQLELLVMNTSNQHLSYNKELIQSNNANIKWNTAKDSIFYLNTWRPINIQKAKKILLFSDSNFLPEAKYIEAGFKAVSKYLNHKIDIIKTNKKGKTGASKFDIVVWLSQQSLIETDAKVVLFRANPFANQLIEESLTPNTFYLTKHLDVENIEKDYLPEQLIKVFDLNPNIKQKIQPHDIRVLEKNAMIPAQSTQKIEQSKTTNLSLTKWLWVIFILLLSIERIASYYRSQ